jgi:uncharacterized membrane protein HdeD (DUF308 family)
MTTTATRVQTAHPLRRLYLVRFAFALVWAGLVFTTASTLGPLAVALLLVYPLFDVAAAVVDLRSTQAPALYVNVVVSLVAVAGLAFAASSGIPGVLRVWGAWAIVAGLVQLAVGVSRRGLGGQWPMIVSGAISTVAGTSFIVQAAGDGASLSLPAGYAAAGGVFFLVSALRLGRAVQDA